MGKYDRPGILPKFIKRIVEAEDTPEGAVSRITSALPYWSLDALRRGAEADKGEYQDKDYHTKLDRLIEHTEKHKCQV
ncbi:MAG: hypothetical protein CMN56_05245 [Sneathiella sp.]|uniref:hypothetical protein n=1 Tax=Sneathiella sp. TaxID=1964365 RepID=UPI000C43F610|nr:hypothetical protein [Sneathiella sp.]MAZ02525.1 hypothetical protein [Sneathiella sp.]|tara:strand:- start:560 stop:793 length:234 start_codon:yes stop_codon:yes gene_type:complete